MWSTPAMTPLAIDGAAPRRTTNRIADSLRLNRTIASGNHVIEGMVWMPVIIEPTAVRSTLHPRRPRCRRDADDHREAEAHAARRNVVPIARHVSAWPSSSKRRGNTVSDRGACSSASTRPHDELPEGEDERECGQLRPQRGPEPPRPMIRGAGRLEGIEPD